MLAAIASCPPWVLAGAVMAHLLTLSFRTEAWRKVLRGTGAEQLDPRDLHAANAGAFLVYAAACWVWRGRVPVGARG